MKLRNRGKSTSKVEIINISPHGIWILVERTEYFLPYNDFPWFKKATLEQIQNARLLHNTHLHLPDLDVDLEVDSLNNVEKYPLTYKN